MRRLVPLVLLVLCAPAVGAAQGTADTTAIRAAALDSIEGTP